MRTGNARVQGQASAATDVTDRLERELQRRQEERMPGLPLRQWARSLLTGTPGRGGGR